MNRMTLKTLCVCLCIFLFATHEAAAAAAPPYAKWGLLAMDQTKQRYPGVSIVDYSHIGRTAVGQGQAQEQFKLWLRRQDRTEFGVLVTIRFNAQTEQVLGIQFVETAKLPPKSLFS